MLEISNLIAVLGSSSFEATNSDESVSLFLIILVGIFVDIFFPRPNFGLVYGAPGFLLKKFLFIFIFI